jgi:hypothetical protein
LGRLPRPGLSPEVSAECPELRQVLGGPLGSFRQDDVAMACSARGLRKPRSGEVVVMIVESDLAIGHEDDRVAFAVASDGGDK